MNLFTYSLGDESPSEFDLLYDTKNRSSMIQIRRHLRREKGKTDDCGSSGMSHHYFSYHLVLSREDKVAK